MQWYSMLLLPDCKSFAVHCRVHTRAASKPLGVLSLSLQNCPEAAAPSDTPSTSAPDNNGAEAGANGVTSPLSIFGAAVKEAVASLVPACIGLPLTVNTVREAERSCIHLVRERIFQAGHPEAAVRLSDYTFTQMHVQMLGQHLLQLVTIQSMLKWCIS